MLIRLLPDVVSSYQISPTLWISAEIYLCMCVCMFYIYILSHTHTLPFLDKILLCSSGRLTLIL